MTKETQKESPKEESKMCMTFLKNVKTKSYEVFKGKRAKLSQSEIDTMHAEMQAVYPIQSQWIVKTQKSKDCNCK